MIQPKTFVGEIPNLYSVGSLGKITNFKETKDGRYLITLDEYLDLEFQMKLKIPNFIGNVRLDMMNSKVTY